MLVNAVAREKREFRSIASLFLSLFNTQIKKPISLERYIGAEDGEKSFAEMTPAEKEQALKELHRRRARRDVKPKKPATERMQTKRAAEKAARFDAGGDRRGSPAES
jgi:hypothetical protein